MNDVKETTLFIFYFDALEKMEFQVIKKSPKKMAREPLEQPRPGIRVPTNNIPGPGA